MRLFDKHSLEHQLNIEAYNEMLRNVPMTIDERSALAYWVREGHEVESNPWGYYDGDGFMLNFLQAYRLEFGYSSGPWDYWKGPDTAEYRRVVPRNRFTGRNKR